MGGIQQEFTQLNTNFLLINPCIFMNTFLSQVLPVLQDQTPPLSSSISSNDLTSFNFHSTLCQNVCFNYYSSDLRVFLAKINPLPVFSLIQSPFAIIDLIPVFPSQGLFCNSVQPNLSFSLLCLFSPKKYVCFPPRNQSIIG